MKLLLWALLFTTVAVTYAGSGVFCSLCTELITSLEDELEDDEGDIIKKANELCDKITKKNDFLDPVCKQIVDMGIENVIDDIEKKEKPETICTKLELCGQ